MDALPIIGDTAVSCDDCNGACCREQGSPPGYLYLLGVTAEKRLESAWDPEDVERVESLPRDALGYLMRYRARLMRNDTAVNGHDPPCCCLNQQTGKCRFYEHRPSICRHELDVGSEGCISWRKQYLTGKESRSAHAHR